MDSPIGTELNRAVQRMLYATLLCIVLPLATMQAVNTDNYITKTPSGHNQFTLAENGKTASLWFSPNDFAGVLRVGNQLKGDIAKVTDSEPVFNITDKTPKESNVVICGTVGKNKLIDKLIKEQKIDGTLLDGKRETYIITTVNKPFKGVEKALVIVGSDKRGTIFGIYDLCEQIGVSPLYYWCDVPVVKSKNLYVNSGTYSLGEPKVYYRGIFINDENPALYGWVNEHFGGFNSQFYEHVFELIARMKGNFLWPAMWGKSLFDDDPKSEALADEYGIVIGTSHHEPMMRAHVEWERYGKGPWNYEQNPDTLKAFWREGVERMGENESVVTVGMRGDGDMPMSRDANVELLENIITTQRQIIEEVTKRPASETPQMWALYKEVQDYYDMGMRVPDDITLMLCDDNWGNVRKLPNLADPKRKGGYGMYYHVDYVGGPRNYKWLNTSPIGRIWEQMNMCYQYGVDKIWVLNVGDIKPMEYPIQFFLDMAWNPEAFSADKLSDYSKNWAAEHFPAEFADQIAEFMTRYTFFNGRRKPELLAPTTYSLTDYNEAENVVESYNALAARATEVYEKIPSNYRDAYYNLVLAPIYACSNVNELYYKAGLNALYAKQERAETNQTADDVRKLFERDSLLTVYYHTQLAGGKWNHMMSQTHIGYRYWQEPAVNSIPRVSRITPVEGAQMRIAVEGSEEFWTNQSTSTATLPTIDPFGGKHSYIEVYNAGNKPFVFSVASSRPWIVLSSTTGIVNSSQRVVVGVDFNVAPKGSYSADLTVISNSGDTINVEVPVFNPEPPMTRGFIESRGGVAFEAEHFSRKIDNNGMKWNVIPDFGSTLSGVMITPVTISALTPTGNSPHLEYQFYNFTEGEAAITVRVAPSLDYNKKGLRYAISVDDGEPQTIDINGQYTDREWNNWVGENVIKTTTKFNLTKGEHTIKYWAVDPGVVVQRIEVDFGGMKPSYLGAPESVKGNN